MENYLVGIYSSLTATAILFFLGWWKRWWFRPKSKESIELAKRIYSFLDGDGGEKTNDLVILTKGLGESLSHTYKSGVPYDETLQAQAQELISQLTSSIRPLSSELSTSDKELKTVKEAFLEYQKSIEWRGSIIKHLYHPPNPSKMDPGHVREQLISVNLEPQKKLYAAQGEAAIFLNGHGLNWINRAKYYRQVRKKERALYLEKLNGEYRNILQQTTLHKAKR